MREKYQPAMEEKINQHNSIMKRAKENWIKILKHIISRDKQNRQYPISVRTSIKMFAYFATQIRVA